MPANNFRQVHLPYCIERTSNGFVVLNRNYKPLGMTTRERVDYELHATKYKGLTSRLAQKISWKGDPSTAKIYLYNDGCIPERSKANMAAYLGRLALVANLRRALP